MFRVAFHLKGVAPLAAKQFDCRFIGREFVRRQQIYGVDFFQRALGIGVKQTQAVNFIIKKIKTIGKLAAHREQVQQRTARGVFTVFHDLINVAISGAFQLFTQRVTR